MTLVSHWMHVDLFTVDQAAALWAGFDPGSVSSVDSFRPSEVIAACQMLTAGIVGGEIHVDTSTNYLATIGNHSKSLLARRDLEAFARKRNLFPAFLFDTLAPFEGNGRLSTGGTIQRTQTLRPENPPSPQSRGGRPQQHDWDTFVFEIIRRANQPDGLPETQAELVRDMLGWFQSTFGREPAESSAKERISKIYRYIAEAENRDK